MKLQIFKSCSGFRSHKRPRDSEYFYFVPRVDVVVRESESISLHNNDDLYNTRTQSLLFFRNIIDLQSICLHINKRRIFYTCIAIVWKQKSDVKQKPNTENSLLFFFSSSNIDVSYFSSLCFFYILFFFLFLIYRYLSFLACFIFILRFFYIYQVLSVSLGVPRVDIRSYYSQRVYPLSIPIYVCNVKEASFSQ